MEKKNDPSKLFLEGWEQYGYSESDIISEFRFHPSRRWRFDWCWPTAKVAVEIEGRGRHQTVIGYRRDCEKYNEAARLGWTVLRIPTTDLRSKNKDGIPYLEEFIELVCDILTQRLTKSDKARLDKQMETVPFVPTTPPCQAPRSLPRKHPLRTYTDWGSPRKD